MASWLVDILLCEHELMQVVLRLVISQLGVFQTEISRSTQEQVKKTATEVSTDTDIHKEVFFVLFCTPLPPEFYLPTSKFSIHCWPVQYVDHHVSSGTHGAASCFNVTRRAYCVHRFTLSSQDPIALCTGALTNQWKMQCNAKDMIPCWLPTHKYCLTEHPVKPEATNTKF